VTGTAPVDESIPFVTGADATTCSWSTYFLFVAEPCGNRGTLIVTHGCVHEHLIRSLTWRRVPAGSAPDDEERPGALYTVSGSSRSGRRAERDSSPLSPWRSEVPTEIETQNDYLVGRRGNEIITLFTPKPSMSRTEALRFAAWLVALADDDDEFPAVLHAVRNT
jgi:hypothetical protein